MSDGFFKGIESVEAFSKLPYFSPGSGIVELQAAKKVESKSEDKFFRTEWLVIESTGPEANPPGSLVSNSIKMNGKYRESALRDVKGIVGALIDEDPKNVTAGDADELANEDKNPGKGTRVRYVATRKDDSTFVRVSFSPYRPAK